MNTSWHKYLPDQTAVIGLMLGVLCLTAALHTEGGSLMYFIKKSALFVVLGGSLGATVIGFRRDAIWNVAVLTFQALRVPEHKRLSTALDLIKFARMARREGILRLESVLHDIQDPILKRCLEILVQHGPGDMLEEYIKLESEKEQRRVALGERFFETLGSFCPTFGIIGTVMSLIEALSDLDKPEILGTKISSAFIATFYGVLFANLVFLPLANRLRSVAEEQRDYLEMVLVALRSIGTTEHPLMLLDRLQVFISDPILEEEAKKAA